MIVRERPSGIRLFFVLRGSILHRIVAVLLVNILVATVVTVAHGTFFHFKITLTPIPFTLIGLALAIFLGFRNSAAYDRYWEGRKLWGQLIFDCRNLTRQCHSLIASPLPLNFTNGFQDIRLRILYRAVAYAHMLRLSLRDSHAHDELKTFLQEQDWNEIQRSSMPLQTLMQQMGRDVRICLDQGNLEAVLAGSIDATLSSMTAVSTGCERIKNTPIPFSYTLLLHRTAYLYCFLLPFGLIESTGYMTPLVVAIVAYTFFGLDALGDEIEEPFGMSDNDLPLDALCQVIEFDARNAVHDPNLPARVAPVNYCLT